MAATKETYNFPGFGNIDALVFPYTKKLLDFFSSKEPDLIERLKENSQLGILSDLHPGLHHTRYEYVFLQLAFVSELKQKGSGSDEFQHIGISRTHNNLGKITSLEKSPSGAEFLQCLILLVNIGHLPTTFTGGRALVELLKSNTQLKRNFKNGIHVNAHSHLENLLLKNHFYNIQIFNTLFLLNRFKRGGESEELTDVCTNIILQYLNGGSSESITKLINLFKLIRNTAFLVLDSYYAPVPFRLDLNNILLNMDEYFINRLNDETYLGETLGSLSNILQDNIYLSPNSILYNSKITSDLYAKYVEFFKLNANAEIGLLNIKKFLLQRKNSSEFEYKKGFSWNKEKSITIHYNNKRDYSSAFTISPVEAESKYKKVHSSGCFFGMESSVLGDSLKISYGTSDDVKNKHQILGILNFINYIYNFNSTLQKNLKQTHNKATYVNPASIRNLTTLLKTFLDGLFNWEGFFQLKYPSKDIGHYKPFIITSGAESSLKEIHEYKNYVSQSFTSDELMEITVLESVIEMECKRKTHLAFLGNVTYTKKNQSTQSAEFDGLILFPASKSLIAIIVESKNYTNGSTDAKRQLENRLKSYLKNSSIRYEIVEIARGSYAKIFIKED